MSQPTPPPADWMRQRADKVGNQLVAGFHFLGLFAIGGATVWAPRRSLEHLEAEVTNPFEPGDALPGGAQSFEGDLRDEVVLWIPAHAALVAGDVLLGDDEGGVRRCPDSWLPEDVSPAEFRAGLQPLLELPVERILLGHGRPVVEEARAKLAAALS